MIVCSQFSCKITMNFFTVVPEANTLLLVKLSTAVSKVDFVVVGFV